MNSHYTHPRNSIIKLEKKIFQENKRIIDDSTVVTDKNFKSYWRHYKSSTKSYQSITHMDHVLSECHKANVILVGDYHTLDQSQRSLVRLMRYYLKTYPKSKFCLALETLQNRHQKHLELYMSDQLNSDEFIKKIGFNQHWFFDLWKNYEILFDFSKHHKIRTLAIDADHRQNVDLNTRDVYMAKKIVEELKNHPDQKIFVLVGDLHLAPKHLPQEIKRQAKSLRLGSVNTVTLYQNSPEIYWKLSEKNLVDHTDFVKVRKNEYCRMHTPPLIVQQSYLNWLYHEEGTFDWVDAKMHFLSLVKQICEILELKLPRDVENIEVFTCGDLSFLSTLKRKKIFSPAEMKFIDFQIRNEQSYFMPKARMVYVANVSIHHAAEEASHYLKFLLSGDEFPRSRKDAFYANVLHEALGFFGSKLINPKRKCPRYQDFVQEKKFLEKSGMETLRALDYDTAQLFIEHYKKLLQKNSLLHTHTIANMSSKLFLSLTHAIGYDLGDQLYFGFMQGRISKKEFKHLFEDPFEAEGKPNQIYLNLFNRLKLIKRPRYL